MFLIFTGSTMLYRMEKIKDILMMDLDDSEVVLNIQMGIHAEENYRRILIISVF